jgi:hypothetical protein
MHRHLPRRALIGTCAVVLLGLLAIGYGLRPPGGADGAPQRQLANGRGAIAPGPQAERPSGPDAPSGRAARRFTQRVRCTEYRRAFGLQLPPDILSLLCDRRPLDAVKLLSAMAEAGDERGRAGLVVLGAAGGSCDILKPSPTFPAYVVAMMRRAKENGATSQTLQRLSEVLAEQQAGPTADELEACRQSAAALRNLWPGMLEEFASTLGRSLKTLRGENAADLQIEYDRKMLVPGDADAQLRLAFELQQQGTADSQAEAEALFRQAASALPAAKSELARCLLTGCPTPASDLTEAHQLLEEAALAGDFSALIMLSGATDPKYLDLTSIVPAPEQYAWSQFLQRLNEEGCFGTSQYIGWAGRPPVAPNLMALSPTDATSAQARAASLVASRLDQTQRLLGCD